MQQMVNGRWVDIPIDPDNTIDGDHLKQVAGIPSDRTLIQQLPSGENLIINPGQKVRVRPEAFFRDVANHIRG